MKILLCALPFMLGCSAKLSDYQDSHPKFDLKQYFDGKVIAWGIVQDYSRQLTRRFCVDIIGSWSGQRGELHETFYFADGEQQVRVWQLKLHENGSVSGTAGDVIGEASGAQLGAAFNWRYTLEVPIGATTYHFAIDDWMYKLDEQRLMNRSYMKKFGITLAEIAIFFDKSEPTKSCPTNR